MSIEGNLELAKDAFEKSSEVEKEGVEVTSWSRSESEGIRTTYAKATYEILQALYFQNKVIIETLNKLYK